MIVSTVQGQTYQDDRTSCPRVDGPGVLQARESQMKGLWSFLEQLDDFLSMCANGLGVMDC